mmetsp:Transcript_45250/g.141840  ORF Transcript_45250/g.141840 Transcript_45250/m.141840 type:complete len:94 (-) Transcript_45250:2281-2562(-)
MSQLSAVSEPGEESQLRDVEKWVEDVEKPPVKQVAKPERIPTGVGVIVLDAAEHPGCALVGRRKGSHGAGKLQLPGKAGDGSQGQGSGRGRES